MTRNSLSLLSYSQLQISIACWFVKLTGVVEDGSLVFTDQLADGVLEGDGGLRGGYVGFLGLRGVTISPRLSVCHTTTSIQH